MYSLYTAREFYQTLRISTEASFYYERYHIGFHFFRTIVVAVATEEDTADENGDQHTKRKFRYRWIMRCENLVEPDMSFNRLPETSTHWYPASALN